MISSATPRVRVDHVGGPLSGGTIFALPVVFRSALSIGKPFNR
jgi:hypothetical protein